MEQVEAVAAVGGNVDEAIPYGDIVRKTLRLGAQIRAFAGEDRVLIREVGQLGRGAGIDFPGEAGEHGADWLDRLTPFADNDEALRGPVLPD